MTKVLLTGAAGFIGFHTAKRLCQAGSVVTGIDNLNDYYDVSLKEARLEILAQYDTFEFHKLDLADREGVKAFFENEKPDVVINLAAQAGVRYSIEHPHAYVDSNIEGFLNILEGCRHQDVKHLIFASSSSVYGANTKVPFSESDNVDHPVSLYAATKKANELMAHTYAHLYGIPCTGLRFFTVYGPYGRPDMAYFKFTKAIFEGRSIQVFNHGDMMRDFTYIDDIVEAIIKLIDHVPEVPAKTKESVSKAPYVLYNIGNNNPESLMDFIQIIENETGVEAVKEMLPMQPGDVYATYADTDDLNAAIGFKPQTPLSEGIAKFVKWYKDYYAIESAPAVEKKAV